MIKQQEVEIKIQLESVSDYGKLLRYLAKKTDNSFVVERQYNEFLDGLNSEILSNKGIFRIRLIENSHKAFLTHKNKGFFKSGVNSVEEMEEEISYDNAMKALNDTSIMFCWDSELMNVLKNIYHFNGLRKLGGFHNYRTIYQWKEQKLEIDLSRFSGGTKYEIEVEINTERTDPVQFKNRLEKMLRKLGINFSNSTKSKFEHFRSDQLNLTCDIKN